MLDGVINLRSSNLMAKGNGEAAWDHTPAIAYKV